MKSLRFLHIPKTAGTTLVHVLRAQYRFSRHFAFSGDADTDERQYEALSCRERSQIALFSGHAPVVTGLDMANQCTTITMLRQPVSRVKSFCQHVSEGKSPHLREAFPAERFNLDEFLWSGNRELPNLQTKMLINSRYCDAPWNSEISETAAVTIAVGNHFGSAAHFGLQEHFNESVTRFRNALGWSRTMHSARNTAATGKRLEFHQHHLERIAELNRVDMEVYRLAEARFNSTRQTQ